MTPKPLAPSLLDRFIPHPDVVERFETRVRAPAAHVLEVACGLDLQFIASVRRIFRMREVLMRATPAPPRPRRGMLPELLDLGWGLVLEEPGRLLVAGAACQPWKSDVVFHDIPAERFAAYAEPDQVKIVWTFEAEPIGPELTRFANETRAVATDAAARAKFRRYWRWARFGIVTIRLLLLPAVRREAERRWRMGGVAPVR